MALLSLPEASLEDLCRRHAEYKVAEKHNDDDTQNAFIKYVLSYPMLCLCAVWCVVPAALRDSLNWPVGTYRTSVPASGAKRVVKKWFVQFDLGASALQRQTTDQVGRESGRRGVRGRRPARDWRRICKASASVFVGCGALQARGYWGRACESTGRLAEGPAQHRRFGSVQAHRQEIQDEECWLPSFLSAVTWWIGDACAMTVLTDSPSCRQSCVEHHGILPCETAAP